VERLKGKLARHAKAVDRREDRIEQDSEKIEADLTQASEVAGSH
jgi:hypothetical protein